MESDIFGTNVNVADDVRHEEGHKGGRTESSSRPCGLRLCCDLVLYTILALIAVAIAGALVVPTLYTKFHSIERCKRCV